jgi:hypothetical protein
MHHRLTVLAGALLVFGAGFLTGHYSGLGTTTDKALAEWGTTTTHSSGAVPNRVGPSGSSAEAAAPVQGIRSAAISKSTETSDTGPFPAQAWLPPPPEPILTPAGQAELIAQQREARRANVERLEAMIQSLEEGGAPEEEVARFRELKKGLEEQPVEEAELLETNPPERTQEELSNDFATSLEQSGMPRAEFEQTLEAFSTAPASINDGADDSSMEMAPPRGPE